MALQSTVAQKSSTYQKTRYFQDLSMLTAMRFSVGCAAAVRPIHRHLTPMVRRCLPFGRGARLCTDL